MEGDKMWHNKRGLILWQHETMTSDGDRVITIKWHDKFWWQHSEEKNVRK